MIADSHPKNSDMNSMRIVRLRPIHTTKQLRRTCEMGKMVILPEE